MNALRPTIETARSHLIPEVWRGGALLALLMTALVLAMLDKYTQTLRADYMLCFVGVCIALDLPAWAGLRSRAFARRMLWALGLFLLTICIAELARHWANRPGVAAGTAWRSFRQLGDGWLWFAILWLYLPALRSATGQSPMLRRQFWLLWAFALGCLCMSVASLAPERSLRAYLSEIGIYAPLVLVIAREGTALPPLRRGLRRWGIRFLLLITACSAAVGIVYAAGGEPVRQWIEARSIPFCVPVRREYITAFDYRWRLQFPFGHHNRLAYFSMVCALIFAGAALARRGRGRIVPLIGAILAVANLMMTLNRGAMAGLAAAVLLLVVMHAGWRGWLVLLLLPVVYLALPAMQRERVNTLFNAKTYQQESSTVVLRETHMRAAWAMIEQYPIDGIGYGWKHFEQYYAQHSSELGDPDADEAVHAHNLWLQVAAEVGVPLAVLYFCWHALRWGWLAWMWRRRRRLPAAWAKRLATWIAIELAIQSFCMINLPLRRSLGVFTYGLWGLMLADLAVMHRFAIRRRGALSVPAAEK